MQEIAPDEDRTITQYVIETEERFDVLQNILQLILQLPWLKIQAGGIFVTDVLQQELRLAAQINFPFDLQKTCSAIPSGYCLCGQVRESQRPDFKEGGDIRFGPCSRELAAYKKYAHPIRHASGDLGVLLLFIAPDHEYTTKEINVISSFAEMIGKSIHAQLNSQEKQLSDLILSHSKNGILITDGELKIKWVNKAFEQTTGYSRAEVIGHSPRLLSSGRHGADFYQSMWREIEKNGLWEGEVWNRRRDGTIYPEWLSIVALKGLHGEILCYAGMFIDLTEMKAAEEKIREMAYVDSLTGLASRDYLQQHLHDTLKIVSRNQSRLALLFIDLDGFKDVNDTQGHDIGDLLLKVIAERLKTSLRESDFVARLGGDEFCIMIENPMDDDCVGRIADSCLETLNKPLSLEGQVLRPTASIGIAYYPDDADSQGELLKAADSAMYAAKKAGKHRYMFYNPKMTRQVIRRLALEHDLQVAIQKGQFELYYQPKVDIRNGELKGVEALIRWHHPEYGMIPPKNFISLAEHIGVIDKIGAWVMETACQQLMVWQASGLDDITMAVNVSSQHFEKKDFPQYVDNLLQQTGVPPERFEIEITESLARNVEMHIQTCDELVRNNIQIAIDDFGTGYSSLGVLKRLSAHTLKIDKLFIDDLLTDVKTATMLGSILSLAEGLGFETVVEGVETLEQVGVLYGLGCRLVQGYFFSKPVTADEIATMARDGFSHLLLPRHKAASDTLNKTQAYDPV